MSTTDTARRNQTTAKPGNDRRTSEKTGGQNRPDRQRNKKITFERIVLNVKAAEELRLLLLDEDGVADEDLLDSALASMRSPLRSRQYVDVKDDEFVFSLAWKDRRMLCELIENDKWPHNNDRSRVAHKLEGALKNKASDVA